MPFSRHWIMHVEATIRIRGGGVSRLAMKNVGGGLTRGGGIDL